MHQPHIGGQSRAMADFLDPGMTVLTESECWKLMARTEVGRLVVCVGGNPEIFPVNFVTDNRTVLIRTAEGTKLAAVAANPQVAFEVDGFDPVRGEAWSVIVRGTARVLDKAQRDPCRPGAPACAMARHAKADLRSNRTGRDQRAALHRRSWTPRTVSLVTLQSQSAHAIQRCGEMMIITADASVSSSHPSA